VVAQKVLNFFIACLFRVYPALTHSSEVEKKMIHRKAKKATPAIWLVNTTLRMKTYFTFFKLKCFIRCMRFVQNFMLKLSSIFFMTSQASFNTSESMVRLCTLSTSKAQKEFHILLAILKKKIVDSLSWTCERKDVFEVFNSLWLLEYLI